MIFKENKAIYLQIADRICEEILTGVYREEERIPSVREYAVKVEVNVNTVMRAFEQLQADGIIYNKRGLGYFVSPGASGLIIKLKLDNFKKNELPEMFRQAELLGITVEELSEMYNKFLSREL